MPRAIARPQCVSAEDDSVTPANDQGLAMAPTLQINRERIVAHFTHLEGLLTARDAAARKADA